MILQIHTLKHLVMICLLKMVVGIRDVFEVADAKQIAATARRTFDKYISSLVFVLRITV